MSLVIVGGFPDGGACGVWGYSVALQAALQEKGVETGIVNANDWTATGFALVMRELRRNNKTILFQYPTAAAHRKVLPILLPLAIWPRRVISVIHEFSQGRLPSRSAIGLIASSSHHVVFTNVNEAEAAWCMFPWLKAKTSIIPVASAIGRGPEAPRRWDLVHFGIIRPSRQIEDFLRVIKQLSDLKPSALLVGAIAQGEKGFADDLRARANKMDLDCIFDASEDDVARLLAQSRIALLPFPDGVSSRRTSALSTMLNGALLVTTTSQDEKALFENISLMGSNLEELSALTRSAVLHLSYYENIIARGISYATDLTWPNIADRFLNVLSNVEDLDVSSLH